MIGWLAGTVVARFTNGAYVLDVHGVGYEVHLASSENLVAGSSLEVFVQTVVRDDAIVLYGFTSLDDRRLFELLLATPGVGPATALGALRTMSASELSAAIDAGDTKRVSKIPGIGPKTAARIVLELKGKLVDVGGAPSTPSLPVSAVDDALRTLGYSTNEIRDALRDVVLPDDEGQALREALQRLGRR